MTKDQCVTADHECPKCDYIPAECPWCEVERMREVLTDWALWHDAIWEGRPPPDDRETLVERTRIVLEGNP
jgi:hypothetical protein